ncbi:hypothetical protein BEN44_01330 [Leptospira interrogans serovar Ricardi]|nr:hypothetical protein [Leptospira interrogans serovar Ricardi]
MFFVSLKLTIKAMNLHYGIFLTILLLKKYSNILSVRFCKVPTHKKSQDPKPLICVPFRDFYRSKK